MVAGAIGAGLGLAATGINYFASERNRRKAERALAALGKRPALTVPKEILDAYQERLRRSRSPQGFSQAELNQMRSAQARQNATMFSRAAGIGSSPMALQAIAANTDARNWADVATRNAAMVREDRSRNLSAAEALAGQIGQYKLMEEQSALSNYNAMQQAYGQAIQTQDLNKREAISGAALLGMNMAIQPELWGISDGSSGGNQRARLDRDVYNIFGGLKR